MGAATRIGRGLASTVLAQLVAALQSFLLIPFFLRAWGTETYGRWLVVVALTSYLVLLELGGQGYIGNLLGNAFARKDEREFARTFSEGVSLFAFVAAFTLAGILVFAGWIVFAPGTHPFTREEAIAGSLLAGVALTGIVGGMYNAAYRGAGLYARGAMIGNIVRLAGLALSLAILAAGLPPVAFAMGLFAQACVVTAVLVIDSRRRIEGVRGLSVSFAHARAGWRHLRGAIYFALLSAAQSAIPQALVLIVAAHLAAVDVAAFSTHRALVGLVSYVLVVVQGPVLPELTLMWGRQAVDQFRETGFLAIRAVAVLGGLVAAAVWLVAPIFFPLWTGGNVHFDRLLLALLLIYGVISAATSATTWGLLSTNRHRNVARFAAVGAAITLLIALLLVPRLGLAGAAMAALLGDAAFALLVYPRLAAGAIGVTPPVVYAQLARAAAVGVLLLTIAWGVDALASDYLALAIGVAIALLLAFPLVRFVAGPHAAGGTRGVLLRFAGALRGR